MNMLQVAPKLTVDEWTTLEYAVNHSFKWEKRVSRHELLLWNKDTLLEILLNWVAMSHAYRYLDIEVELLKKLGWDGVRRDDKEPARPRA